MRSNGVADRASAQSFSALDYVDDVTRRQRLNAIVSAVVERETMNVVELADQFRVSQATIRRDLEVLEDEKLITRTHGGAAIHSGFNDLPLRYKTTQDSLEKCRIATRALEFLAGARVVGLTGGTTVTEFARLLTGNATVSVVTNALNVASLLVSGGGSRVLVAGGEARRSSHETVGPAAESFLAGYHTDVAFLGVDGVDPEVGCTNYDPFGARVNAIMRERARQTIVLADATKISRVALAAVCEMSAVNVLITDSRAPGDALERIRRLGCRVITV